MDKNENSLAENEVSSESINTFSTNNFNSSGGVPEPSPAKAPSPPATASDPNTRPVPTPAQVTEAVIKTDTNPNEFITTTESAPGEKKGKFGKFVLIGIIIIVLIYGIVFFLYTRNQNIRNKVNSVVNNEATQTTTPETSVEPTTTPSFSPEAVKVLNGNVVYESEFESKVLINKADYPGTGITGFAKVTVSPDNTHICAEVLPPAPQAAIYLADNSGTVVKEVALDKAKCMFTIDSKNIVYESLGTAQSDIFSYNISTNLEKDLTPETLDSDYPKAFRFVGFNADGSKIVCSFTDLEEVEKGQCEIDITTSQVTYN